MHPSVEEYRILSMFNKELEKAAINCKNVSAWYAGQLAKNTTTDMDGLPDSGPSQKDRGAVLYIVVVLLFYSLGIIIAIVTYLKRERAEMEEEKAYEDYMTFRNDPYKFSRYYRMQQVLERLNIVDAEKKLKKERAMKERPLSVTSVTSEKMPDENGDPPGTLSVIVEKAHDENDVTTEITQGQGIKQTDVVETHVQIQTPSSTMVTCV